MVAEQCPGRNAEIAEECPGDYIFRNSSVIWIFKCNFEVFQLFLHNGKTLAFYFVQNITLIICIQII